MFSAVNGFRILAPDLLRKLTHLGSTEGRKSGAGCCQLTQLASDNEIRTHNMVAASLAGVAALARADCGGPLQPASTLDSAAVSQSPGAG